MVFSVISGEELWLPFLNNFLLDNPIFKNSDLRQVFGKAVFCGFVRFIVALQIAQVNHGISNQYILNLANIQAFWLA